MIKTSQPMIEMKKKEEEKERVVARNPANERE
jgi:hypothetical protein